MTCSRRQRLDRFLRRLERRRGTRPTLVQLTDEALGILEGLTRHAPRHSLDRLRSRYRWLRPLSPPGRH